MPGPAAAIPGVLAPPNLPRAPGQAHPLAGCLADHPLLFLEESLMVLLAILTGIVVVFVWRRHTTMPELAILCGWGLLAAATPIGRIPAGWLYSLSGYLTHWF